jgi:hypothetical protein
MLDIPLQGCMIRLSSPSDLAQSYLPRCHLPLRLPAATNFRRVNSLRQPISGSLPALEPLTGLAFHCDPAKTFLTIATQLRLSLQLRPS